MPTAANPARTQRPRNVVGGFERQLPNLPKEVRFCTKCVMSNQRPRIVFDEEGVCSACRFAYQKYHVIDWAKRESELEELLEGYRRKDGAWDVLVPGSGGKDSSFVAHQLKAKFGMHPLTVTWAPFRYTEIGWKNYQSFVHSGFSNLLAFPNGRLHRKLSRLAFEEMGDAFQPFQYGQMAYPLHIALKFRIPLIFYGENGEAEYGGDTTRRQTADNAQQEWDWHYFHGTAVDELLARAVQHKDYFTPEDLDPAELSLYRCPPIEEVQRAKIKIHWYSYYRKWVPQEHYYYAAKHTDFVANAERSEGTYSKYASLDDRMDGFHYFLMFIKFGIGRATSDAAHEVRDGHLTREEAVALVRRYDGEFPNRNFKEFLEYVDINEEQFWEVVNYYRQPHIWERVSGSWTLRHRVS